jgi:hypothetical protein
MLTCYFITTVNCAITGRASSNRIPLSKLNCFSEKRLKGKSARLGESQGDSGERAMLQKQTRTGLCYFHALVTGPLDSLMPPLCIRLIEKFLVGVASRRRPYFCYSSQGFIQNSGSLFDTHGLSHAFQR